MKHDYDDYYKRVNRTVQRNNLDSEKVKLDAEEQGLNQMSMKLSKQCPA